MLPLSLLLVCLPVSQALSWVYAPTAPMEPLAARVDGGPTPAEIAAILEASDSLNAYAKKPDCFRRAVGVMRAKCDELETNELERVRAALSMTLCEIATAEDQSPPLECAHIQSGVPSQHDISPGKCVSALSRSAQYWSSYSGYLREVSQLCFAFHRWNDVDTAREVHKNATVKTIAVLQYMSDREKRMQASWDESNAILGSMRVILDKLHASTAAIDFVSSAVADKLNVALVEMTDAHKTVMLELREHEGRKQAEKLSEMDAAISYALDRLATSTANVAPTIERLLVEQLNITFSSLTWQLKGIGALADQAGSRFMVFERTFEELQHMTTTLVADVRQAGAAMEEHLQSSHMVQEKQLEIVKAADHVSSVLSETVVKAYVGIQELNGTISEVKDSLKSVYHQDWTVSLWMWFQEAALHLLRIHPGQPLFQALDGFMRVLRVLVALGSSSLMLLAIECGCSRDLRQKPVPEGPPAGRAANERLYLCYRGRTNSPTCKNQDNRLYNGGLLAGLDFTNSRSCMAALCLCFGKAFWLDEF